jgi:hypothetical protein
VNICNYTILIENADDFCMCTVLKGNNQERRYFFFKMTDMMGSVFGRCSYGAPLIDGVPCHHMISVVKSSSVEGLNLNKSMPNRWTTGM